MALVTDRERLVHLLWRAGFGEAPASFERYVGLGLDGAIDTLLKPPSQPESIAPPQWKEPFDATKHGDAGAYWIHRMAVTHHPLVEKMTLFWHGHLTSGMHKVGKVLPMVRQNELLRKYALGSFPQLLREISKDAAMLIWLDGRSSHKRAPNENYAREVMELFTCGPGVYTERDVQAAARAFTGWQVNKDVYEVSFNRRAFDEGAKTFLGRTGRFGTDDIIDILAHLPQTARFLSTKLWRFFASPTPDPDVINAMAEAYLTSGGEVAPVLKALFGSQAFYRANVVGSLIKSPVEFVAGVHRMLTLPVTRDAHWQAQRMGQEIYNPPNVAGWPGGAAWLGSGSLLTRINLGEGVRGAMGQKPDPGRMLRFTTEGAIVIGWLDALGITQPSPETHSALMAIAGGGSLSDPRIRWEVNRNVVRTVIASPEFQLS